MRDEAAVTQESAPVECRRVLFCGIGGVGVKAVDRGDA